MRVSTLAGRFRIEREIGSGGIARVFLGTDEVLGRPVAVRVLKAGFGEGDVAERFRREGRNAARLSHPNVVQVYDAGEDEIEGRELSYVVMEYVPGGDLERLIDEQGPLSAGRLARLGSEVAAGLAHAHSRGVIHRDVKPHNVLLDESGHVRLTDFGIARALDSTQATRTGSYLRTALYSSPEQLRGEEATPESDVYSLGVTLYQAATGETPFSGSSVEVANQHVSREPPAPDEMGVSLDRGLETLILSCLAKDPGARPDAEEVRRKLANRRDDTAATRPYAATPPSAAFATRKVKHAPAAYAPARVRPRRKRFKGLLAAIALLAVFVAGAALAAPAVLDGDGPLAGQKDSKPERDQSKDQQESAPTEPEQNARGQTGGGLTGSAASQAVLRMYVSAAKGDYAASYGSLSRGYRQSTPETEWAGTFDTLRSIRFVEGPTATVYGDTATVTGTTIARHTYGPERNTGTWTLVNEDGEWKVSAISIQNARI